MLFIAQYSFRIWQPVLLLLISRFDSVNIVKFNDFLNAFIILLKKKENSSCNQK